MEKTKKLFIESSVVEHLSVLWPKFMMFYYPERLEIWATLFSFQG